ncbi:serine hydrolase domain-containing protein [Solimonas sp. K1W22B-7]|uniref:serine hydrolase domain-containing protein n=1 Tax=Solimonas sp. K1W22B-7 TaxID=2303331 RepID=UPI0013C455D0|nr:serine hydrolase domain-containing protein [Solimonas sp. K1W22B-7]
MSDARSPAPLAIAQKLDELFKPWNRSDAPGMTVGIRHQGKLIYRHGFGLASIEHAVANTPGMRMRIGSTSKHFCCLGIMLLAEDGRVDIDKPVGHYLPELGAICGRPTLLQLMHHTGGLHDPAALTLFQYGGQYPQLARGGHLQLMPLLEAVNFAPGSRFAYSNSGYHLLSVLIERLSGQEWGEFMDQRVFAPLGMSATALLRSDLDVCPNMASLHVRMPDGQWRRGIYPSDELLGSGGMISTVDDMLVWTEHLRSKQKRVGSAATWSRMLEPQTFPNGSGHCYALGLHIERHRGVKIIQHAGATLGSMHQMLIAPEHGLDIIVMCNRMDAPAPALALKALEAVLEGEGLGPEVIPPAAADHPALQGRWYSRASKTLVEITAYRAHPDRPECLALSTFNQLVGVLRRADMGLAQPDGPFSTLEIRQPPEGSIPPATIDVHICGEPECFEHLPDVPPAAESLSAELCGRYRQPGYPKEMEIALRDGKLVLDLLPLHGYGYWELQPYSREVLGCGLFHSEPQDPLPRKAMLVVQRQDDKVTGLLLSFDRLRGVPFARVQGHRE